MLLCKELIDKECLCDDFIYGLNLELKIISSYTVVNHLKFIVKIKYLNTVKTCIEEPFNHAPACIFIGVIRYHACTGCSPKPIEITYCLNLNALSLTHKCMKDGHN